MRVDLLAGTLYAPARMPPRAPTILVFDSGLGGLTVFSELRKARPDARFVYAADDAAFPYGRLTEAELVARVLAVMERLIDAACARSRRDRLQHGLDAGAAATCASASRIPFVGTVPAIKPAARSRASKRFSVLATPGTVARDYTRDLDRDLRRRTAASPSSARAGSPRWPRRSSPARRRPTPRSRPRSRPASSRTRTARTDVIVLACTHYPLLLPRFVPLAPWPVTWIDPAPAIARRVVQLIGEPLDPDAATDEAFAVFTSAAGIGEPLRGALAARGLPRFRVETVPMARG